MTDNFVVSLIDNKYIIGSNNLTTQPNRQRGVKDASLLGSYLYIPSIINNSKIEEIGCYAFFRCECLEKVVIENGIKQINRGAFSDNTNLQHVTIPASIEFLGYLAIHCYNISLRLENNSLPLSAYTTKGTLTVVFMPDSQIGYLSSQIISRKEKIVIYYLGRKSPLYSPDPFDTNITIYAPHVQRFGGVKVKRHCTLRMKYSQSYSVSLFIAISYIYS